MVGRRRSPHVACEDDTIMPAKMPTVGNIQDRISSDLIGMTMHNRRHLEGNTLNAAAVCSR